MNKTNIEWTDATWNPIRGCSRVSEGCRNCYAEKVAYRFSGPGQPYEGLVGVFNSTKKPVWNGTVRFVEEHLLDPLKLGPVVTGCLTGNEIPHAKAGHCPDCKERPRRIFVNSMSDLFHPNVPDEWIDRIFAVIALCPQHQFQILTKRPERMLRYISDTSIRGLGLGSDVITRIADRADVAPMEVRKRWPLPNVWLGVSDEGNQHGRIDILRNIPAAIRFISAEPLIFEPGTVNLSGIDWVIVGGESGSGARPMHPDWARSLRVQCQNAGVPFFMKQMGSVFGPNKGHDLPADLDIRQFPELQ